MRDTNKIKKKKVYRGASEEVVATRKSLDGVIVYMHADGSLSTLMHYVKGGKLPKEKMWRFAEDICAMNFVEIPAAVRAEKTGKRKP